MLLVWFYLFFIAFTQVFVLVSLLVLHPPTVDSRIHFVDCANTTSEVTRLLTAAAQPTSLVSRLYDVVINRRGEEACDAGTGRGQACPAGLSEMALELCLGLDVAFPADLGGKTVVYRTLEEKTYFYENIFGSDSWLILLLQLVCCVWVTVQVYFVDFTEVVHLLKFRDFNRWVSADMYLNCLSNAVNVYTTLPRRPKRADAAIITRNTIQIV